MRPIDLLVRHSVPAAALLLVVLTVIAGIAVAVRRHRRSRAPAAGEWPDRVTATMTAAERAAALDPVDEETHEAMARLTDAVRNHDLSGGPTTEGADGGTLPVPAPASLPMTPAELEAASPAALRERMRLVQDRNAKLQKVVLAQQASLVGEREAHERTRELARRAALAARTATEHKRIAAKAARRERTERLRIADEHERVSDALSNAVALLRATGTAVPDAASPPRPARPDGGAGPSDENQVQNGSG